VIYTTISISCFDVLARFAISDNGQIARDDAHVIRNQTLIASLSRGNRPNIYLDRERNVYQLTQRGYDTLMQNGANANGMRAQRANLPDYVRPANSGSIYRERNARRNATNGEQIVNMVEFEIDRNEYIKIKCKVNDAFKNWIKAHGALRNFESDYGNETARNWDADNETKYYNVQLPTIDDASRGSNNIIHGAGINSLILKLACASETNEYTVKYRGLVAWETVNLHGQRLGESVKTFYNNFVKPFNLKIAVQYVL